ncbi:MAG: glycogen synthase [Thermodesulfovibrionales bacterium]|nr:glycogen synthase [Thermodesulfovibrionales bacterium]
MKIAIVVSEAIPFSKTGGLADVAGTLYRQYRKMGEDVYLFVPLYRRTFEKFQSEIEETSFYFDISMDRDSKPCKVYKLMEKGTITLKSKPEKLYFIANKEFFDRSELYEEWFGEYHDNADRFAFFCKSVLELIKALGVNFDIIHCHDWQTGLIPLYLKTIYSNSDVFRGTRTVFTIHNVAYQGLFPPDKLNITGLGNEVFHPEGIEFYGKISYLKAGIISADAITTVSKSYAKEILTPDYGFSMDGILRKRANSIYGIVNGIDYDEWDPATDPHIPFKYNKNRLSGKKNNKKELLNKCLLEDDSEKPLLCFIGRLSFQKGVDLLIASLDDFILRDANLIIIGKGQVEYHEPLSFLQQKYPKNVYFYNGFDEPFAHLAYAAADIFLMPSRYEPCGLGQMIAMRYGAIPVARRTGGLADLIEDGVSGFLFESFTKEAFSLAIKTALYTYRYKKLWIELVKNAMSKNFSWEKSAKEYLDLYATLLK